MDGMRRFIVRATNPNGRLIQLSILCSNPKMDMEEAVWLMFNRWLQENNFKYLNAHFGLDQLTSYGIKDFDKDDFIDQEVDTKEYKELKASLNKEENSWAKSLLNKEKKQRAIELLIQQLIKLEDKKLIETQKRAKIFEANPKLKPKSKPLKDKDTLLRQLNRDLKALSKKIKTAKSRVSILSTNIENSSQLCKEISLKLDNTLRKESKLNRLIENNFKRHDTRAKAMLDALRVTASNMFASLVADFRPLYGNHRNDHAMLRQLTRADGFVETKNGHTIVSLWLKGTYQKKQLEAFDKFLNLLSNKINNHFGSSFIPLQIRLLKEPLQS
jgi:molybdopterin converting factor small subunit